MSDKLSEATSELEKVRNDLKLVREEAASKSADMDNEDSKINVHNLQEENTNLHNEILHLKASLHQKKTELSTLRSTAVCQKSELDRLLALNEKLESDYSLAITQIETLKNINEEKDNKNKLKDEELRCLKNKLSSKVKSEAAPLMELKKMDTGLAVEEVGEAKLLITSIDSCSSFLVKEEPRDDEHLADGNDHHHVNIGSVKLEPNDDTERENRCLNVNDQHIVLNIDDQDILAKVKCEPEEEPDEVSTSDNTIDQQLVIAPWPAFVPLASHPELSFEKGKKRLSESVGEKSVSSKKNKPCLEDVTDQYQNEDAEEEVLCGLCNHYDPPLSSDHNSGETYTTEWVGCDCDRWFHKPCTKMKRFTDKFSCRSLKMKCLNKANIVSK